MTIWVLTAGQYSDYTVYGVYSSEELAKEAGRYLIGANDPLKFEVNEWLRDSEAPPGLYPYLVSIKRNGDINDIQTGRIHPHMFRSDFQDAPGYWDDGKEQLCYHTALPGEDNVTFVPGSGKPGYKNWYMAVWAKDEDHAVKIAGERRARYLAEDIWDHPERLKDD